MEDLHPHHLLTRRDVSRRYGIPIRFLETAPARGDGPPMVRLGRSVRYRVCDVEAWLESLAATEA